MAVVLTRCGSRRKFVTKPPARRFRSRVITAYEDGEWFDPATGEPESWRPNESGRQMPVYDWARKWLGDEWPELAPRTRDSYAEALARFVPLVVADGAPSPPPGTWRWLVSLMSTGGRNDAMAPHEAMSATDQKDELTIEEANEFAEEETRHHLGMSVAEFKRRAEEGTLPDHPVVPHLVLITGARAKNYC